MAEFRQREVLRGWQRAGRGASADAGQRDDRDRRDQQRRAGGDDLGGTAHAAQPLRQRPRRRPGRRHSRLWPSRLWPGRLGRGPGRRLAVHRRVQVPRGWPACAGAGKPAGGSPAAVIAGSMRSNLLPGPGVLRIRMRSTGPGRGRPGCGAAMTGCRWPGFLSRVSSAMTR